METNRYNYKKGLVAMLVCYLIWGFQPLYFVLDQEIDTVFLLACRIIWGALVCLIIVMAQGNLQELKRVFTDKKILTKEIPAALLLFADWGIYLYAVRYGKVMEASMGYYIMPLVMCAFGAIIFKEEMKKIHFLALIFIVIGIILSAQGFGGFPTVTISLSLCFAVYSALKKSLDVDSIVTTTAEILMMVPFAIAYVLIFARADLAAVTVSRQLFVMGSGIVSGLPMVFFAVGVTNLPLSFTGIMQYLSPTLGLICSRIMGESFNRDKLISFIFIWIGVVIYASCEFQKARKRNN